MQVFEHLALLFSVFVLIIWSKFRQYTSVSLYWCFTDFSKWASDNSSWQASIWRTSHSIQMAIWLWKGRILVEKQVVSKGTNIRTLNDIVRYLLQMCALALTSSHPASSLPHMFRCAIFVIKKFILEVVIAFSLNIVQIPENCLFTTVIENGHLRLFNYFDSCVSATPV